MPSLSPFEISRIIYRIVRMTAMLLNLAIRPLSVGNMAFRPAPSFPNAPAAPAASLFFCFSSPSKSTRAGMVAPLIVFVTPDISEESSLSSGFRLRTVSAIGASLNAMASMNTAILSCADLAASLIPSRPLTTSESFACGGLFNVLNSSSMAALFSAAFCAIVDCCMALSSWATAFAASLTAATSACVLSITCCVFAI